MREIIINLLKEPEDEYHDFKAQWYGESDKSELIRDVFSFVNTTHYEDCYLIIGVNDNHEIVGIENDKNRLNTQNITDFLHTLPIANSHIPKVLVESIRISGHTIDVLVIKDTSNVPVYLDEDKRPTHAKRPIHAGQIFTRDNDVNTPINESANDGIVERLWKKRFGEDLPIKERYKIKLRDYHHWEYFELDKTGLQYTLNPDYCMYLEEDDEGRYRTESYAMGQYKLDMLWKIISLKYKNRTIDEILAVFMDGSRFMTVVPSLSSVRDQFPFQYYLINSLNYAVERLILNMHKEPITPDFSQKRKVLNRIVKFSDYQQLKQVTEELGNQVDRIKEICTPTKEQLESCKVAVSLDFKSDDPEMATWHIEQMCKESNVSQFINKYLATRSI